MALVEIGKIQFIDDGRRYITEQDDVFRDGFRLDGDGDLIVVTKAGTIRITRFDDVACPEFTQGKTGQFLVASLIVMSLIFYPQIPFLPDNLIGTVPSSILTGVSPVQKASERV